MRLLLPVLLTFVTSWIVSGQTYTISTFAGGGLPVNIPGTSASLYTPSSVAVDKSGNVFFADFDEHVVLRLDATTGVLTLAAGNGAAGFSGDNGPAASAQLNEPAGVALDSAGNLYIADTGNSRIRKVSGGVITTVAGNGNFGFSGDNGPAASASLDEPCGVAVDPAGNLYIADNTNNRIRKVLNGLITTVAGNGFQGFSGDNAPATTAVLNQPQSVAVDSAGNLYIADEGNHRVRMVANGLITTVAGTGIAGFGGDNGPAASAQLHFPSGVVADAAGNLFIADSFNRVRKVSNGTIITVAGNGSNGDNGPAASSQLSPLGVTVDSAGTLYIAETGRVRKVSNGTITTVAGGGTSLDENVRATSAALFPLPGVAVDAAGNLYVSDALSRIRNVSGGVMTTVAGNGFPGFSGDNGPATSAQLNSPVSIAVDAAGNLYIDDQGNIRIRKVSDGVITTVAGNGFPAFSGDDGPATSAQFFTPTAVAVDATGNLYIADSISDRVRKVANGVITTVAGNGKAGFSGDNGPAISAGLSQPAGIAVDSAGNLYIAEPGNNRIRKVSTGVITTVAGNGTRAFSGDNGPATSAALNIPRASQWILPAIFTSPTQVTTASVS